MTTPHSIVQFHEATTAANPFYESAIWNVSFTLAPGELLLIRLEKEHLRLPLADAAAGLAPLSHGAVRFLGLDWREMPAGEAAASRGRIGRVFQAGGWVNDLSVDENVLLPQQHHTDRPTAEIFEEATRWAQRFGLPGLPRGLPAKVRRQDLRKAEIVRAFLGQPQLIILESPTRGIYADTIAPLVNAVQSARKRGAAVLWTSSENEVWNNPGLRPTVCGKMFGSQLHLMEP